VPPVHVHLGSGWLFNGSNASEQVNVSPSDQRLRFTRDIGAITMDLNEFEDVRTIP